MTFPIEIAVGEASLADRQVFSAIVRDPTAHQHVEDSRATLGRILEASRNEIFVFDGETLEFRLVNQAARDNLGFSEEELLAMTPLDIKPKLSEAEFRSLLKPLLNGERDVISFRTLHRRKDGSEYRADVRLQYLKERNEYVAIILDMSEQEELERQLQYAQRMEAIGTLAGGVAHDFKNLLTSILGSAELILAGADPESATKRRAERIVKATARGDALTRQLLAFSRKQVTRPKRLDLNQAIREAAELFGPMIGEDITVDWALAREVGVVDFDPAQFDQVVINLVVNARDAMPNGGCLSISTGRDYLDHARASALGIVPGAYLRISIQDSGSGIPANLTSKIFDPFFTTKERGKGTGLGLSTVYGIVRQHDGAITVESEEGRGTTFSLYLPSAEGAAAEVGTPKQEALPTVTGQAATLLIVEDDPLLREMMKEVLEEAGYRVLCAEGPAAAIELSRSEGGKIDLVVTDVVMPKMNGFELAKKLAEARDDLRVLFMSGYSDQSLADRGESIEESALLRKPFSNGDLCRKIAMMIADGEEG
jgi:PAS domain S-box-containing protein